MLCLNGGKRLRQLVDIRINVASVLCPAGELPLKRELIGYLDSGSLKYYYEFWLYS